MSYCERMAEIEKKAKELLEEDIKEAGLKPEFTSECKEEKMFHVVMVLSPTKFKTPPVLHAKCEDESCYAELHVRTSPAKAEQIRRWAAEKGYFASNCFRLPTFSCYGKGGMVVAIHAPIKEVEKRVTELLSQFKRQID